MPAGADAPDAGQDVTFGLFDWIDAAPGRTPGEVYQSRLRLLTEADRGGFSVYHLAEHHGTPLGLAPSPALFLAAAAQATERIRLAPTTFIVPLYDPLRLVQEICMLDQLSGGRLEIGVGKGSSPHEAAMFGLTPSQAADRFEELMPAVLEALETGVFVRPGPDGDAEPVALHVSVRQRPHPPLWYPTSNPASIPRLGEEGYNVVFVPFRNGMPTGGVEVFADGFIGEGAVNLPADADHRPVGLAQGPDGSLYVTDDRGGRIYRILHASRR